MAVIVKHSIYSTVHGCDSKALYI